MKCKRAAALSQFHTNIVSSHRQCKNPRRGTDGRAAIEATYDHSHNPPPHPPSPPFTGCNPARAFGFAAASSMTLARASRQRGPGSPGALRRGAKSAKRRRRGRRRREESVPANQQRFLSSSIFKLTQVFDPRVFPTSPPNFKYADDVTLFSNVHQASFKGVQPKFQPPPQLTPTKKTCAAALAPSDS